MLTQTLFEQPPLASAPPRPSPSKFLSSPLVSHRCAHLRPHPLSFDIHPQNTQGWGIYLSAKILISSPIDPLSPLFSSSALRPLPPLFPLPPLTPPDSALTKNRGEGPPGLSNLSTNSSRNGTGSEIPLTSGSKHFVREGCADKRPGENS